MAGGLRLRPSGLQPERGELGSRPAQHPLGRLFGVDARAVVDRQHIGVDVHHHLELGAGEHDRLGAACSFSVIMVLSARSASRVALPDHQLVVDDPVERLDVVEVGRQQVDAVRHQPAAVELSVITFRLRILALRW